MNSSPSLSLKNWTVSTKMWHTIAVGSNKEVDKQQECVSKNGYAIQEEVDKQHKYGPHEDKRTSSTNVPYKERWTNSTNVPHKEKRTSSTNVCHRTVVPYKEGWTNSTKYRFEPVAYWDSNRVLSVHFPSALLLHHPQTVTEIIRHLDSQRPAWKVEKICGKGG